MREDWDGGRFDAFDPPPEEVVESSEQCSRACAEDPSCLQWKWEGRDRKKCNLLGSLQHGRERKEEKEGNDKETWVDFTSGWVEEHIREWKEKQDCSNIKWLGASIERKL